MIFISTNFLKAQDFNKIFDYVPQIINKLGIEIGIEIFPFWDTKEFEYQITENIIKLKQYPISFHDPYKTEHSAVKGSDIYIKTINDFTKTLSYSRILNGYHIVIHQNNCKISTDNKENILKFSAQNLIQLHKLCTCFHTELLVENAGTFAEKNMLLNQNEFEQFCYLNNYSALIDVGHAYCNHWDIEKLINTLGNRIKAYHLHNNYGYDTHNRILDGGFKYDSFLSMCSQLTPNASFILEYSPDCLCTVKDFCEDIQYISSYIT